MTPSVGPLTDENRFRELGDEGILAMMSRITTPTRHAQMAVSPSEKEISAGLRGVIEQAGGQGGAITPFSSMSAHPLDRGSGRADAGREV